MPVSLFLDPARQPGDPLPGELVKEIRLAQELSQDELAARLGLRGGKSVISGWETGRARCEGPAAELLLKLFKEGDRGAPSSLLADVDATWKRAGNYVSAWRQIAILPIGAVSIDREAFANLFPGAEIPPEQHVHGFPFVGHGHGLPDDVYSLGPEGWTGAIPTELNRPTTYLWRLTRHAAFVHRERVWEDDPLSVTGGHIHFGAQFNLVVPAIYFYKRLAERCQLDGALKCRVQLDLEGIAGRGMVAYHSGRALDDFTLDAPLGASSRNHLSVTLTASVQDIVADPKRVASSLVGEAALVMRPDLASDSALDEQLRRRHRQDDGGGDIRYLGVLDDKESRWRRATVSMAGVRVGVLRETQNGTQFEYDEEYLRRPDALAISPTLPLKGRVFTGAGLLPFFANLLPEGTRLTWVSRRLGLDPNDRLGILLATGHDTIGAIEIHAENARRR